jgi:predicted O-methyltransferase YrrM
MHSRQLWSGAVDSVPAGAHHLVQRKVPPVTRYPRLLWLAPFVVVAAAAAAGASLVATPAAAAVIGALLGLVFAVARDGRNRLIGVTNEVRRLERQSRADADRQRADADRQVAELDRLGERVEALWALESDIGKSLTSRVAELRRKTDQDFHQLESLANLFALFDMRGIVPPSRGFAASPDLLHAYVGEILDRRPSLVVECGSGLSTLWAAYALERCGGEGRVVALENDEYYAEKTRAALRAHGLSHRVDVRHAELREVQLGGHSPSWYDTDRIADLYAVDVLLVDGPVGSLARHSRYPALPLFRDRLSPGAVILLDDASREEEQEIAERWREEFPELKAELISHEKGTALFRLPDKD